MRHELLALFCEPLQAVLLIKSQQRAMAFQLLDFLPAGIVVEPNFIEGILGTKGEIGAHPIHNVSPGIA